MGARAKARSRACTSGFNSITPCPPPPYVLVRHVGTIRDPPLGEPQGQAHKMGAESLKKVRKYAASITALAMDLYDQQL